MYKHNFKFYGGTQFFKIAHYWDQQIADNYSAMGLKAPFNIAPGHLGP